MYQDPHNPLLVLLKFGTEEHMKSLLKEGAMYFETLKYFRDLDDGGELRGDPNEALSEIYHGPLIDKLTMTTADGITYDLLDPKNGMIPERLEIRFSAAEQLNVFCSYAVTPRSIYIDPRCLKFGTHAVLIRDWREFFKRVHLASKRDGTFQAFTGDMVRYVEDGVHTGEFAPFCKYKPYAYQSELRLVLSPPPPVGKPFMLRVGSLEDIAELCVSAELNNNLSIDYNLLPSTVP